MRRTRNEIYRLCQKAARGAGVPAGLEFEAARAAAWLAARGVPALRMLARDLSRGPGSQDGHCSYGSLNGSIDANGKSGAIVAPLLVDMILISGIENAAPLKLKNLSSPLYLVPAAAGYTHNGWCFDFSLCSVGSGAFHVTVAPELGVSVKTSSDSELTALADGTFDVIARCRSCTDSTALQDDDGDVTLLDDNALSHAAQNSLVSGVEVDVQTWRQLAGYAAKVLVPASEKSRSRAGAATSDTD